jgi:hypothetical protein
MKRSFKSLFCEAYDCPAQEFEQRLFRRCVHRPALPLALIISRLRPEFFREDLGFLREVGAATTRSEVVGELNRFYGRNVRDRNWVRTTLGIRVSGKHVLEIYRALFRGARRQNAKRS